MIAFGFHPDQNYSPTKANHLVHVDAINRPGRVAGPMQHISNLWVIRHGAGCRCVMRQRPHPVAHRPMCTGINGDMDCHREGSSNPSARTMRLPTPSRFAILFSCVVLWGLDRAISSALIATNSRQAAIPNDETLAS